MVNHPAAMVADEAENLRVIVDGKFFRIGEKKFYVKGVTYGPFPPNESGQHFPEKGQAEADLRQIAALGANTLRVYHTPPEWLLDLAVEYGLRLLVDIPWWKTGCFLDSEETKKEARSAVRSAVAMCKGHQGVFAFSLVNEVAPDVVRWHGEKALGDFINELADIAHEADPGCLVTFGNYPPTEYLSASRIDFVCFNVYLHEQASLKRYLSHLQMLVDAKPLVLGEIGVDSKEEGDGSQTEMLRWQIETCFRVGLAGVCVFSFTDEWYKDGRLIEGWEFGLVTANRSPKPAFAAVQVAYAIAPYFELKSAPRVSVVVATYNGSKWLRICLRSLMKLNYPDYEVIVVDDGSTDSVAEIAKTFERVRYIRQKNMGLSVARNTGMEAATGEIVAYTDDDCRADEDWLYYLAGDLAESDFVAMGGHNFLPPDDSPTAAAVMAAPGGPIHVMLTETEAEHIPGCNMAFRKGALESIGGFDPVYRKAGDDVDVCWRLQQAGHRIGFNPAGFVWHYRRSTMGAYLTQQAGYGEAEAMLYRKHPDKFSSWGGGRWHGRIYAPASWFPMSADRIYRGAYGEGMFQTVYSKGMNWSWAAYTSLEHQVFFTLPLFLAAWVWGYPALWILAWVAVVLWFGIGAYAGFQSEIPVARCRWWSRPLVTILYLLQPIRRSWARYSERFNWRQSPLKKRETLDTLSLKRANDDFAMASYWSEEPKPRSVFLESLLRRLRDDEWMAHADAGWGDCDIELQGSRWCRLQVTTVSEWHKGGKVMLRCRIGARWSLLSKILMFFAVVAAVLVAGMPIELAWRWCFLMTLPVALVLWVNYRKQTLRRIFAVILDQVAVADGWKKVGGGPAAAPKVVAPVNNAASTPPKPPVYAPEWFSTWNSSSTF